MNTGNEQAKDGGVPTRDRLLTLATILFLVVIWTFRPALDNDFITFDDPDFVTANSHVQHGLTWAGVRWAFHAYRETANWHPLTWLSHMLDCQLFGLDPHAHHRTNVVFHGANTVLLFLLLTRLTRSMWKSFFVAALFGLHPLRVESVAWISERKDVLSVFFLLLTLLAYVKHVSSVECRVSRNQTSSPFTRHPSPFYWLALFFFACGLMAKPSLVTTPILLLLLDRWPLGRVPSPKSNVQSLLVEKIPFFLLAGAVSVGTLLVHRNSGDLVAMSPFPLTARVANALVSYCRYLGDIFWPQDLCVFYPPVRHWPMMIVIGAIALLLAISAAAFLTRRSRPFVPMGWLWFLVALAPMIGLLQVGAQAMADRHSYVASIGIFVIVVWTVAHAAGRKRPRLVAAFITGLAVLVACSALTRRQISYWRNSGTLFQHAIDVTKDNAVAHLHLAIYDADHDRAVEAAEIYRGLIRDHPAYASAYFAYGNLLLRQGDLTNAVAQFETTVRLNPGDAEAHNNLGVALGREGNDDDAARQLAKAVRLAPDYSKAQANLGIVLAAAGKTNDAIVHLKEALRLDPADVQAKRELQRLSPSLP